MQMFNILRFRPIDKTQKKIEQWNLDSSVIEFTIHFYAIIHNS